MVTAAEAEDKTTVATQKRHEDKDADAMLDTVSAPVVLVCHVVIMSRRSYYN